MSFQIEEARREGARLVIGIAGVSGAGKTYTALQIAWGLANGDASKVGLLCTENKRGRLYADVLKDKEGNIHRFRIADFIAPFSPSRYVEAIHAFAAAGVEVLVIDSVSHEWEGLGGCEDIAHANPLKPAWNKAKGEHKKFMNALLASPMHIIPCMRAREKVKVTGSGATMKYESQGIMPICEKNFMFELTASMMLYGGGRERDNLKMPADLLPIFGAIGFHSDGYLTPKHGLALRRWVDGADKQQDGAEQAARDSLHLASQGGMVKLSAAWAALPKELRAKIGGDGGCPEVYKSAAGAFDQQAAEGKGEGQQQADSLNDELGVSDE